jgi:hypothetical protein
MKNLLYFSLGGFPYPSETVFSILSVFRYLPEKPIDIRVIVYTDRPDVFHRLPVTVEPVTPSLQAQWSGPGRNFFRYKMILLAEVLRRYREPVVSIDSDTYFLRSPAELFGRIRPGGTLMHIREGRINSDPGWKPFADLSVTDAAGESWHIPSDVYMWNAGVVGIDPADAGLVDRVLRLEEALYSNERWASEQFSWSYCLAQATTLRPCDDVLFHYWDSTFRKPFLQKLEQFMPRYENLPLVERARRCYARRPVAPIGWAIRQSARGVLERVRLLKPRQDEINSFMPRLRRWARE